MLVKVRCGGQRLCQRTAEMAAKNDRTFAAETCVKRRELMTTAPGSRVTATVSIVAFAGVYSQ